jgi:hypothetical protein
MLLELFLIFLIVGITVIVVLLKNKKPKGCPDADPNGVYDSNCKLTGCTGDYIQDGNVCKSTSTKSCSPPSDNPNADYEIDINGKCVMTGCKDGYIKEPDGICRQVTCEQIDPTICKDQCSLPFPILEGTKYTTSKTPRPNFKQYITKLGIDGKQYCALESCVDGAPKNQWWCDSNDCDSIKYGSYDTSVHLTDANAYWTYMFTDDNKEYCMFQKCKDGYGAVSSTKLCGQGKCNSGSTEQCDNCPFAFATLTCDGNGNWQGNCDCDPFQ